VSLSATLRDAWRKNGPEVLGLVNGALPTFVTRPRPRDDLSGVPVFCYHIVETEEFEAQLDFLKTNGYRTLSARELAEYLTGTRELTERAVMLSFDDGARNFYDVAFPLLKRYQAKAVHFIAPGLHADAGVDPTVSARPMTWQEISEIHASGLVEFQSHTLESRFVPNWPTIAALAGCDPALEASRRRAPLALDADLAASRQCLSQRLPGVQVEHLAFPQYLGTPEGVDVARRTGFRACYWGLIAGRPINRRGESPYHVSRISDEYLRRLPGRGRISLAELVRGRLRRIQAGKAWRAQHS
jgi:peptidoglycan/xylan/chitin deacetylase (PgdA/CDA1 family)